MLATSPRYPARATLRLPLPEALRAIEEMARTAAPGGPAARFGREYLKLDEQAFREWYPRAWWGHYATSACILRIPSPKKWEEVVALVRNPELSLLEERMAEGKGVIVIVGHIGVPHVLASVLSANGKPALRLTRAKMFQHPSVDIKKRFEADYLAQLQVKALYHLRAGGTVFTSPDGGPARKVTEGLFMGHPVAIPRATSTLARISGAPALPCVTRWVGHALEIEIFEPILPQTEDAEEWDAQWNQLYLAWLENQYRNRPEVTLFGNGLLKHLLQGEG